MIKPFLKGGLNMAIILCISLVLLGVLLGWTGHSFAMTSSVSGTLKIDTSDPDGPYLFLELTDDMEALRHQDYTVLKVDITNYLSRD